MAIKYIEKGLGMWQAIEAAGHWLRQNNRVWECSDEAAVQAIIDAHPISETIAEKQLEVDQFASQVRVKKLGEPSPEQAMWTVKADQAERFLATNDPLQAPLIADEASFRGETVQALATRIRDKSNAQKTLEARISGVAGKHKRALMTMAKENPTAADFRAVIDYDYKADINWPRT
jgi:hypothetical protein